MCCVFFCCIYTSANFIFKIYYQPEFLPEHSLLAHTKNVDEGPGHVDNTRLLHMPVQKWHNKYAIRTKLDELGQMVYLLFSASILMISEECSSNASFLPNTVSGRVLFT